MAFIVATVILVRNNSATRRSEMPAVPAPLPAEATHVIRRNRPACPASGTAQCDPKSAPGAPFGDPRDLRQDLRRGRPLGFGRLDDEPSGADPHRYQV